MFLIKKILFLKPQLKEKKSFIHLNNMIQTVFSKKSKMETNIISDTVIIGKNVKIGNFCIIEDNVVIGDNTIIKNFVELRKNTVIGENCFIDSRVSSSGNCVIGNNVTIRYDSIIARGVIIGDNTYISPKMMTNNLNTKMSQIGGAEIGANVFIGTNCVLQHGIKIGTNCILGSLSFINKNIPENEIWFGNPAKFYKINEEDNSLSDIHLTR